MKAMENQRCSDEFCCWVYVLAGWIQLSRKFSHHKQSADAQTRFQKSWDTVQIVNKKGMQ